MSYAVELINTEEKDRLFEIYESQLLYTIKAEIYGCCMKILTDSEAAKNKWEDNFFLRTKTIVHTDDYLFYQSQVKLSASNMIHTRRQLF